MHAKDSKSFTERVDKVSSSKFSIVRNVWIADGWDGSSEGATITMRGLFKFDIPVNVNGSNCD